MIEDKRTSRMPAWLKGRIPRADELGEMERLLGPLKLHTICESGRCPNQAQCFPKGAAFLILGNTCTRNCSFCAVEHTPPLPPDIEEPAHIVDAARQLGLDYVFITSVTRDDLPDGGAGHYARTITELHREIPGIKVEVLIPDFGGSIAALKTVLTAGPAVIGHNLETVPRLYPVVRPMATYLRSLELLRQAKDIAPGAYTKSGVMLGLGETKAEVVGVMQDLRAVGCDQLTLGQYMQPGGNNIPVTRYVTPEEFEEYRITGLALGFKAMASAPLWRSSFKADELYRAAEQGTCS